MTRQETLKEIIDYGTQYYLDPYESLRQYSYVQRRIYNKQENIKVQDNNLDDYCLALTKRYISRYHRK